MKSIQLKVAGPNYSRGLPSMPTKSIIARGLYLGMQHLTKRFKFREYLRNGTIKLKISDVLRSRPIIDCQDAGFPDPSANPRPVCFPRYVSGEHQGVCD